MQSLTAEKRTITGKAVKSLRGKGMLPAVVYGARAPSQPILVPEKAFRKVLFEAGESSLITLTVDGKLFNVLIHDVALDPLTERPLHVDFLAVEMDKEIRTKVPLEFTGESPAVKNESGVLVKVMHEFEISALPKDLPHSIRADVTPLEHIHDRLLVRQIEVPDGVKVIGAADEVVALIEPPRSEEELKALETTEPVTAVAVETEREAKKKAEEATASLGEEKSSEGKSSEK